MVTAVSVSCSVAGCPRTRAGLVVLLRKVVVLRLVQFPVKVLQSLDHLLVPRLTVILLELDIEQVRDDPIRSQNSRIQPTSKVQMLTAFLQNLELSTHHFLADKVIGGVVGIGHGIEIAVDGSVELVDFQRGVVAETEAPVLVETVEAEAHRRGGGMPGGSRNSHPHRNTQKKHSQHSSVIGLWEEAEKCANQSCSP